MESGTHIEGRDAAHAELRVYVPDRQRGLGLRVWAEMARELWRARDLAWRLAWRDVVARYKQSVFGVLWAVFTPVAMMLTFAYLKRAQFFAIQDAEIPYPLFVYCGLVPWQLFATCLTKSTSSLVQATDLVKKINFPREVLVLAKVGEALFGFLMASLVLVGLFVYYGTWPAWTVVFYPLVLALLLMFAVGLGLMLSLLEGAVRDVGNALGIILLLWLLLTPVVYPAPTGWPAVMLNWLNPLSPIIVSIRDLTFHGTLTMPRQLLVSALVCVLVTGVGWRMFHFVEPKIAERV